VIKRRIQSQVQPQTAQDESVFGRLRLDIHRERIEIKGVEHEVKQKIEEASPQVDRAA
jgi:hypothetical protein